MIEDESESRHYRNGRNRQRLRPAARRPGALVARGNLCGEADDRTGGLDVDGDRRALRFFVADHLDSHLGTLAARALNGERQHMKAKKAISVIPAGEPE